MSEAPTTRLGVFVFLLAGIAIDYIAAKGNFTTSDPVIAQTLKTNDTQKEPFE